MQNNFNTNIRIEDLYKSIYNNRMNEFTNALKNYYKIISELETKTKAPRTFFDYTNAVGAIALSTLKGFKDAYIDFYAAFAYAGINLVNDLANVITVEGDTPEAREQRARGLAYAAGNLPLTLIEGFANAAYQMTGTFSSLIEGGGLLAQEITGADTTGFQEYFGGFKELSQITQQALRNAGTATRAYMLGEQNAFDAMFATNPTSPFYDEAIAQNQINRDRVRDQTAGFDFKSLDPRLFDEDSLLRNFGIDDTPYTAEDLLKTSVDLRNALVGVTDKIILQEHFSRKAQEAFGDSRIYQTLEGSFDSIGKILAMQATARISKTSGKAPQQVAFDARSFYFSQMAANSFQDAITSGADIQDAWTYALGVATLETAIENLGGFTFDNLAGGQVLRNMLEEGMEEVIAEVLQPGLEMYKTGVQEEIDPGEFILNGLYAFASGAIASGVIGGMQNIVLNRTLTNQTERLKTQWDIDVNKKGEEYARGRFLSEVEALVELFNGDRAMGQVFDENGNLLIKNMTTQERSNFIQSTVLKDLVRLNSEGKFELIPDAINKVKNDMFVNKDDDGNIINNSDYAINENITGVDITDGKRVQVKKVSELNENGKRIYEFIKNRNAPIAIVSDNVSNGFLTTGVYGQNGVIYISESVINNNSPQKMATIILKHEAIHELKKRDPEGFKQLQEAFEKIVNIKYETAEDGLLKPILEFQNNEIESLIGEELRRDVEASFEDYLLQGVPVEQILNLMNEETVAYFTEKVITDAAYLNLIDSKNPNLFQRLINTFGFNNPTLIQTDVQSKGARKMLGMYAQTWKKGIQTVQENRRSLETYMDRIFGNEIGLYNILTDEAISKYGINEIKKALTEGTYDPNNNTLEIKGERVSLDTILKQEFNWSNLTPKRVEVLTDEQRVENFEYQTSEKAKYIRDLNRYARLLDQAMMATLEGDRSDRNEVRQKLNLVETILDNFKDDPNFTITDPEHIKILLESAPQVIRGRENIVTPTKTLQRTTEGKVLAAAVKRAVNMFKEYTAFKDFKNGAFTNGAAYYVENVQSEATARDIHKTLDILINNIATGKGKYLLRGNYEADYNLDTSVTPMVATFMVAPTQQFIDQEVEKAQQRLLQEERADDIQSAENNDGLTIQQRKDLQKYYTSKEMAQTAFNTVVATLEQNGIDINDLTIIESSAGNGVFVEVFKEFNPDIEVLSYDVKPEASGIEVQDFLELRKDFDANSIVIGNPPYRGDMDAKFINKALKISPVVAYILPGTWHSSYSKQSQIDFRAELIYNERLGIQSFDFGGQSIPVKTVLQIWANSEMDSRYRNANDLRIRKPNPRKSPFFYSMVLDGTEAKYNQLKADVEAGFTFDFAVHRRGNYTNFNEKFTSVDQLKPKSEYIIFKANSPDALNILQNLDYEQIALNGSDHRKGFKLYDIIAEFNKNVPPKRIQRLANEGENVRVDSQNYVLTPEQVAFFKDSKIRNENGDLIRLFHGSLNTEITEFSPEFAGQGSGVPESIMYFTDNFTTAKDFSAERVPTDSMFFEKKTGVEGTVYEVYLDIKNPFDLRSLNAKQEQLLGDLLAKQFGIEGERGVEWVQNAKQNHQLVKTVLNDTILKENGYDGLIAEMYIGTGIYEYGVLSPQQIKATENANPQPTSNIYDQDPLIKRAQRVSELTQEQKDSIREVFKSDEFISEYFVSDSKGNLIPKQQYVRNASAKQNMVTLKHVNRSGQVVESKYRASEYAINVDVGNDVLVDISNLSDSKLDLVKISDLSKDPKAIQIYNVLKSFGIRFVGYTGGDAGTVGFSYNTKRFKHDVMFINFDSLTQVPERIIMVLVHEYTHELFKSNPELLLESVAFMYNNFFTEVQGKVYATEVFKDFLKNDLQGNLAYAKDFIAYLKRNYAGFKNVKTADDLGLIFKKAIEGGIDLFNPMDTERSALNELIAQFYGHIFTSPNFVNKYFKADDISSYKLFNIYDRVLNTNNFSKAQKQLFEAQGKSFYNAHLAHQKYMRKLYPSPKQKVTPQFIDNFVKTYSDGKYNNRIELTNAYLQELSNNKRGEASSTLNNIIYLASRLGPTVKGAVNAYQQLAQEFQSTLDIIDRLIAKPEDSGYLTKDGIIKEYNQLKKISLEKAQEFFAGMRNAAMFANLARGNFAFDSMEYMQRMMEVMDDFVGNYLEIDPDILKVFNLPDATTIEFYYDTVVKGFNLVEGVFDDLNMGIIQQDNYDAIVLSELVTPIERFFNQINPVESLNNVEYKTLLEINKVQESILKKDARIFYNTLNNILKRTVTQIKSKSLQSKSDFNIELQKSIEILSDLLNAIKTKNLNVRALQKEIFNSIEALDNLVTNSDRVQQIYAQQNATGEFDEAKTQEYIKNTFMFDIYASYSVLFGDNVLESKFPNMQGIKGRDVSEFGYKPSAAQFGRFLSNLLQAVQTRYTTVFDDTKTHQEYAEETVGKMIPLESDKTNDHLMTGTRSFKNNVTTPQDFLPKYAETFKQYKIDFFEKYWKTYFETSFRSEQIMAEHDRSSKEFLQSHPDILNWEQQKVTLPDGTFYALNPQDYDAVRVETRQEYDVVSKNIKDSQQKVRELKIQKDIKQKELNELREQFRALTTPTSKKGVMLRSKIDQLKSEVAKARSELRAERNNLKRLRTRLPYNLFLKQKLMEQVQKTKLTSPQISKGAVASLYLSLIREQEMHDQKKDIVPYDQSTLKPTNHWEIGGAFNYFDSEKARRNYEAEKIEAGKRTYINMLPRVETISLLKQIIDSDPNFAVAIDFAKSRFNANYDSINEVYRQIYQRDMPKQETYIPFRTLDSNFSRDLKLQLAGSYNIGTPDGMTLETTIGASTPLAIQNLFSVVNSSTMNASKYAYERLIHDFENLMVTRVNGVYDFRKVLSYIDNGAFVDYFRNTFVTLMGLRGQDTPFLERFVNQALNNMVSATMTLSGSVLLKQFISISNIAFKNGLNPAQLIKNLAIHGTPFIQTEHRRWLMENNANFYNRAKLNGVLALSEVAYGETGLKKTKFIYKTAQKITSAPLGWADSSVLVSAFATIAENIQKQNPKLTQQEVFEKANAELNLTVLMYGVANTNPAFRSSYSTNRNILSRIVSRFQSEAIMQVSGLITSIEMQKKGLKTLHPARVAAGFLSSAFISALISSAFSRIRRRVDEEDAVADLLLNEFLMQNLIGSIPYINFITSVFNFQFTEDGVKLRQAYDVRIPLASEIIDLTRTVITLTEKAEEGRPIGRAMFRLAEVTGQLVGLPVRNLGRLLELISKIDDEFDANFAEWYYSRTSTEQLNRAIKNGDTGQIQVYMQRSIQNATVRNEIISTLLEDNSLKLNVRQYDSFKAKDPATGRMVEYKIPERVNEKYKLLTQRALQHLTRTQQYRRMTNEEKIAAVQRVYNYYYNFMKNEILVKEYAKLSGRQKLEVGYDKMRRKQILDVGQVVENAIRG